jgi:acyl dehydratase
VSKDAIRHFAQGTDDDNPLWNDPDYAAQTQYGKLIAPPAFVFANRYPILHGAPMQAPLASLIGGVEVEWFAPVYVGDTLRSEPRQKDFFEKRNQQGRRLNFVISEITYWNQHDTVVARATGTMMTFRTTQQRICSVCKTPGAVSTAGARITCISRMWRSVRKFPPSCAVR